MLVIFCMALLTSPSVLFWSSCETATESFDIRKPACKTIINKIVITTREIPMLIPHISLSFPERYIFWILVARHRFFTVINISFIENRRKQWRISYNVSIVWSAEVKWNWNRLIINLAVNSLYNYHHLKSVYLFWESLFLAQLQNQTYGRRGSATRRR